MSEHTPSEDFVPRAELRYHQIPEPIREIALRNALVQQVARAYATGEIITLEECLAQMIVALADYHATMDKLVVNLVEKCGIVYDRFSR